MAAKLVCFLLAAASATLAAPTARQAQIVGAVANGAEAPASTWELAAQLPPPTPLASVDPVPSATAAASESAWDLTPQLPPPAVVNAINSGAQDAHVEDQAPWSLVPILPPPAPSADAAAAPAPIATQAPAAAPEAVLSGANQGLGA